MANGNFGGGNGTAETPYLVEDQADLNAVRNDMSAAYRQTADIAISGDWEPIGSSTSSFFGAYNGNGFNVTNLNMSATTDYTGLFGYVSDAALIANLHVSGNITSTAQYTGGICGYYTGSDHNFINCSFKGDVSGTGNYVGGICGRGYVANATFEGTVKGSSSYVGGITGYGACNDCVSTRTSDLTGVSYLGGITGNGTCYRCRSNGSVIGTGSYVAGITAYGSCSDCHVTGTLIKGYSYVGGCAARLMGTYRRNSCSASVEGTTKDLTGGRIGGIVGSFYSVGTFVIEDCSFTGEYVKSNYTAYGISDMSGNKSSNGIFRCYCSGTIIGNTAYGIGSQARDCVYDGALVYAKTSYAMGIGSSALRSYVTGNVSGYNGAYGIGSGTTKSCFYLGEFVEVEDTSTSNLALIGTGTLSDNYALDTAVLRHGRSAVVDG